MLIDAHVHITQNTRPDSKNYLAYMDRFGVDRTVLYAESPLFHEKSDAVKKAYNNARLERLMQWCGGSDQRLLPVYYINPTETDAIAQVDRALDAGCIGFKVICQTFYPDDERAMPVYRHIADAGKSILFHSGILWAAGDCSRYNRPVEWECMTQVPNIKFALAHISWPWTDECIAVFGKFSCMPYWDEHYANQKMYIDITPGTPACYRREVLKRLLDVNYDGTKERLLFGSDRFTGDIDAGTEEPGFVRDRLLLEELGLSAREIDGILGGNALEFWGIKE